MAWALAVFGGDRDRPITIGVDLTAPLIRINQMESNLMTTQSEAFTALAKTEHFGHVRDLAKALFALRDTMATELAWGRMSDTAKAAFATADAFADATVVALKAVDEPEAPEPAPEA